MANKVFKEGYMNQGQINMTIREMQRDITFLKNWLSHLVDKADRQNITTLALEERIERLEKE